MVSGVNGQSSGNGNWGVNQESTRISQNNTDNMGVNQQNQINNNNVSVNNNDDNATKITKDGCSLELNSTNNQTNSLNSINYQNSTLQSITNIQINQTNNNITINNNHLSNKEFEILLAFLLEKMKEQMELMALFLKELLHGKRNQNIEFRIPEQDDQSIESVSDRLFNFAKAITNGDPNKMNEMKDAINEGFQAAEQMLGGSLPQISYDTLDLTMEKIDTYISSELNIDTSGMFGAGNFGGGVVGGAGGQGGVSGGDAGGSAGDGGE